MAMVRRWNNRLGTLALAVLISGSVRVQAQDSPNPAAEPLNVNSVTKEAGQPVRIIYGNGNEIGFRSRKVFMPFQTTATLSDNTCMQAVGTKVRYVAPVIVRMVVPFWKSHPSKQGQPVTRIDSTDGRRKVKSTTPIQSRNTDENFTRHLLASDLEIQAPEVHNLALANPDAVGWLQCRSGCDDILPDVSEIQFWDENFEVTNGQLAMIQGAGLASVNQMVSRLQQVPIWSESSRIYFGNPRIAFGPFSNVFPPGITYQFQWNLKAKNLVDVDDSLCQIKWDLDFSEIFTQFTKFQTLTEDPAMALEVGMTEYLYQPEDGSSLFMGSYFEDYNWENTEIEQ